MSKTNTEVTDAKTVSLAQQMAYANEAGSGFEEADSSAYAIPFIQILQSSSPQCKKSDGAYIKGAEEGMLYNTVTQELYDGDEGVHAIPVHYTNRFNEWAPRESGGGLIGTFTPDSLPTTTRNPRGQDITEGGNVLADTRNHYVLILKGGVVSPALLSMASTQIKKSRQWMSKMQGIKVKDPASGMFVTAAMYSREYKITTRAESNDKGSWYGYHVELVGEVTDPSTYAAAIDFRNAVKTGGATHSSGTSTEEKTVDTF